MKRPGARVVGVIDVKDFGSDAFRIGDLNADGAPDLLLVQCSFHTRQITCLTAVTFGGTVLWQKGKASGGNGRIYSDLPVQIYDFDGDGWNEVLYVEQATYLDPPPPPERLYREHGESFAGPATMVVLDAATGEEKRRFATPAPGDDCFLFADLTGRGRRQDLVVKDRYRQMFGVSYEGKTLWHWRDVTGHFPAVADVDGDGRDEVFGGFHLLDHDGKVLWAHEHHQQHQDAAWITRLQDGSWRLLFGNGGVHCLTPSGQELWRYELSEAQHVICSRFRPELGEQQVVAVNRGVRNETGKSELLMLSMDGELIWKVEDEPGSWCGACLPVDWSGHGEAREVMVYGRGAGRDALIYDGHGKVIERLPMVTAAGRPAEDQRAAFLGLVADVWGDGREEVILSGSRGACVYANAQAMQKETLYNETFYPGM